MSASEPGENEAYQGEGEDEGATSGEHHGNAARASD